MHTKQTTKPQPRKETWLDPPWTQPDDPEPQRVFTRDELAERLRILTPQTTAADLQYWEAKRILPQPIRRRHAGATRTIYPDWYSHLVRRLRQLQDAGYSLRQIKEKIRAEASFLKRGETPEDLDLHLPTDASVGLATFARMYEEIAGASVTRIEIRLIDASGSGAVYSYDLAPGGRPSAYPLPPSRE